MKKTDKIEERKGEGKIPFVIIGFIIAIISLIIILYVFFQLNPQQTVDKTTCHNSVVTRATVPLVPKDTVPLNCKTNYICLSKDGSCENMTNPQIINVKTKQDVYSALAEKMADCWWMFGQGKLNYIGSGFSSNLYCSICSQVGFDDSVYTLFSTNPSPVSRASAGIPESYSNFLIDKGDFYNYLANANVSGQDVTYLNYLIGLKNSITISNVLKSNSSNFGYIDLEKRQLIVMGQFSNVDDFHNILLGIGKGALLFAVLPIPVVGGPLAEAILISPFYNVAKGGGYLIGTIVTGDSGMGYLSPTIIEANSQDYSNLKCVDVKTLA